MDSTKELLVRSASLVFTLTCLASVGAIAANEIRISAPIKGSSVWQDMASEFSDWVNIGDPSNCTSVTPAAGEVSAGKVFTQTLSGCTQAQSRTVTELLRNSATGEVKAVSTLNEQRVLSDYSYAKQGVGTSNTTCEYSDPGTSWVEGGERQSDPSYYGTALSWNGMTFGQTIYSGPINEPFDHLDKDGYRYTRGQFKESSFLNEPRKLYYFRYEICKTPL
ncbi:hypothetical protein [Pseudomonas amygdali]|uniref:hypothetical protein n=1 Tax=Pseudomonas amygdali TaxID=47877 RepID=UPI0011C3E167|nr:hypothetical protein [Pseudomonas amygdali]